MRWDLIARRVGRVVHKGYCCVLTIGSDSLSKSIRPNHSCTRNDLKQVRVLPAAGLISTDDVSTALKSL